MFTVLTLPRYLLDSHRNCTDNTFETASCLEGGYLETVLCRLFHIRQYESKTGSDLLDLIPRDNELARSQSTLSDFLNVQQFGPSIFHPRMEVLPHSIKDRQQGFSLPYKLLLTDSMTTRGLISLTSCGQQPRASGLLESFVACG